MMRMQCGSCKELKDLTVEDYVPHERSRKSASGRPEVIPGSDAVVTYRCNKCQQVQQHAIRPPLSDSELERYNYLR